MRSRLYQTLVALMGLVGFAVYCDVAWHGSHKVAGRPVAYGTPCADPGSSYLTREDCEQARLLLGLKGHCARIP